MGDKTESLAGALAIGVVVFVLAVVANPYHPARFSGRDVSNGVVIALLAIAYLQIKARTSRPLRSILFGCLASAALFWLVCWDAVIDHSGRYDVGLVWTFWIGVTVIGMLGIIGIERANRSDVE